MSIESYKALTLNGLWRNNPALVQLLGLCPLLAVSSNVVNALGLALATLLVLVASSTLVSAIRNTVPETVRLPVFVMIIATAVTIAELVMQAFAYELYQILGIFLPLITTNCAILGRADAYASKNSVIPAFIDALMMGLGFGLVLVTLGMARELLGTGALFADMHLLFGSGAISWHWVIFEHYEPFLLAVLPPGAFLLTGVLIALKNWLDQTLQERSTPAPETRPAGSKRVRVTGVIK
jgi:electron transport complex protein RnfE